MDHEIKNRRESAPPLDHCAVLELRGAVDGARVAESRGALALAIPTSWLRLRVRRRAKSPFRASLRVKKD